MSSVVNNDLYYLSQDEALPISASTAAWLELVSWHSITGIGGKTGCLGAVLVLDVQR